MRHGGKWISEVAKFRRKKSSLRNVMDKVKIKCCTGFIILVPMEFAACAVP